jgi:hypothetical protein
MGGNTSRVVLVFPPELERKIIELAAHDHPICMPTLMLVAWRVKEWCVVFNRPVSRTYGRCGHQGRATALSDPFLWIILPS